MEFESILKAIKKKEASPVYLLHGEESFFIDKISDAIEAELLNETEKAFNLTVLYGKDVDHLAILDQVRRYPVMAERQVVIVKEAQMMKDLEKLEKYVSQPLSSTILCIAYKNDKYDGRKKLPKSVGAGKGIVFESNRLYDNQVPDWVVKYLSGKSLSIEAAAATLLTEYLGNDLSKVANELDKLALNLPPNATITIKHIEDNIGISKDFNVFELQKAMAARDGYKIQLIVNHFISNLKENPLVKVNASLFNFFQQLYVAQAYRSQGEKEMVGALFMPNADENTLNASYRKMAWKLKDIKVGLQHYNKPQTEAAIEVLHQFDLRSKGIGSVGSDEGGLMREMIGRVLNGAAS